jgi:hypothetical protein
MVIPGELLEARGEARYFGDDVRELTSLSSKEANFIK